MALDAAFVVELRRCVGAVSLGGECGRRAAQRAFAAVAEYGLAERVEPRQAGFERALCTHHALLVAADAARREPNQKTASRLAAALEGVVRLGMYEAPPPPRL